MAGDPSDTPYARGLKREIRNRVRARAAADSIFAKGVHLSYPEAVRLAGLRLCGANWIGPITINEKAAIEVGADHPRYADYVRRDRERQAQIRGVEEWLMKLDLVAEMHGHRVVDRVKLEAALTEYGDAPIPQTNAPQRVIEPSPSPLMSAAVDVALNSTATPPSWLDSGARATSEVLQQRSMNDASDEPRRTLLAVVTWERLKDRDFTALANSRDEYVREFAWARLRWPNSAVTLTVEELRRLDPTKPNDLAARERFQNGPDSERDSAAASFDQVTALDKIEWRLERGEISCSALTHKYGPAAALRELRDSGVLANPKAREWVYLGFSAAKLLGAEPAGAPPAPSYGTGLAGRPTSWQLLEGECRRRVQDGEQHDSVFAWATTLLAWLRDAHPHAAQPKQKTVTNKLGNLLAELDAHPSRARTGSRE